MKHISPVVAAALSGLDPDKAARVRTVANANTSSTSIRGSARPVPMVDKANKLVDETQQFGKPSPVAPPRGGSTKPAHTWPAPTPFKAESGRAVPGRIGTMPSSKAQPR